MKLWLDDERPMPVGFDIHVKTAQMAIAVLKSNLEITEVSLDHDLGDLNGDCGDGYEVACFIEQGAYDGTLKKLKWNVHSANPTGRDKMVITLHIADSFWG